MEDLRIGDQVVFKETNIKTIRKMQENCFSNWEKLMEELKNGPGKLCELTESTGYVEAQSGEVYIVNRKLLTKYKRSSNFELGDKVEIIRSEKLFKQFMGNSREEQKEVTEILGKKVEIVQKFVDGDYGVKYNDKIFMIKEKCVAKKESIQGIANNVSDPRIENMKTLLSIAILNGDLSQVAALIDKIGVNILMFESYPLILASATGYQHIIGYLLQKKADVNMKDEDGDTALHVAVQRNQLEICGLLLQYGADVNSLNNGKETPIIIAVNMDFPEILKLLVCRKEANLLIGNIVDQTALHLAILQSKVECVDILLDAGGCPQSVRKTQDLPFHIAVIKDDTRILELFLKKFGDSIINIRVADNQSAVFYAVNGNKIKSLKLLIDYKADINVQNSLLQTPLHVAVTMRNMSCVKMLVENSAKLELKDSTGCTPLHLAICLHNMDVSNTKLLNDEQLRHLMACFPVPNASGKLEDIVIYLAKSGARMDMIKEHGLTPLNKCMDELLMKRLMAIRDERNSQKTKTCKITASIPKSVAVTKSTTQEHEELRETLNRLKNEMTCKLCNERRKNTVFGCGHTFCDICVKELLECRICRYRIGVKIRMIE